MATVYGNQISFDSGKGWWRTKVDYSGSSATVTLEVKSGYTVFVRITGTVNGVANSTLTYSSSATATHTLGTVSINSSSSNSIALTCTKGTWGQNGTSTASIPQQTASFNLNILNPDGSEPYTTGEAGSVEQSVGGGNYARIYNEQASAYNIGTTFNYRNFTPGVGRQLSSVSGISPNNTTGPWSATLGSGGLTVVFQTAWQTYTISYAPNGGSSTPEPQTKTYGTAINLRPAITKASSYPSGYTVSFSGNEGTYSGNPITATDTITYDFEGWKSGNSGTVYDGEVSFSEEGNVTMTAQWGSSTTKGSITLPTASSVSRQYYSFNSWNTNSVGTGTSYSGGAAYTPASNITLYATWTPNAPINLSLSRSSSTTNSITLTYTDEGVVTSRTAYYRKTGTTNYTSMAVVSNPFTITGLDVDTNYDIYFEASNSAASSTTAAQQFSTLLTNPTIVNTNYSDLTPFTVTITCSANISPSRTLSYQFSKDGGSTWTSAQSSNSYQWTNLLEETSYSMAVKVTAAHTGTNSVDTYAQSTITIVTPADQARLRRKVNGSWEVGKGYYKNNGEWTKIKKIYIKVNGEWKIGKNLE